MVAAAGAAETGTGAAGGMAGTTLGITIAIATSLSARQSVSTMAIMAEAATANAVSIIAPAIAAFTGATTATEAAYTAARLSGASPDRSYPVKYDWSIMLFVPDIFPVHRSPIGDSLERMLCQSLFRGALWMRSQTLHREPETPGSITLLKAKSLAAFGDRSRTQRNKHALWDRGQFILIIQALEVVPPERSQEASYRERRS